MSIRSINFEEIQISDVATKGVIHIVLIIASAITIIPFIWAFLVSLKPPGTVFTTIYTIIPANPTLHNYVVSWIQFPMDRWLINSLIITTGAVFFSLLFDSLAGFALAKGRFVGRDIMFMMVIGTLVIPPQAILIPLYLEMVALNLYNTYWAMMILVIAAPFGTFMMRQFYVNIPDTLIEAARIDGCNVFQTYLRIMLPMGKPALSSLAVFKFIFMWGAFLWPLVIADTTTMFPLQVGLGLLTGQYGQTAWGQIIAAAIMAALPVLTAYVFAQRTFMEGIAIQGGKG